MILWQPKMKKSLGFYLYVWYLTTRNPAIPQFRGEKNSDTLNDFAIAINNAII